MSTHKCPIVPGSISEVVINFLCMRLRSSKHFATREEIFDLAPGKFNKIDNLQRALDRLENMNLIYRKVSDAGVSEWIITEQGLDVPNQVATIRRQSPKHKVDADDF